MKPIHREELEALLRTYEGHPSYVHVEAIPGAFVRNAKLVVERAFVAGAGPYRVAIRFAEDGWVRVEGLTHQTVDEAGRLLLAGHDDKGRLTAALEISRERFPA